MKKFNYKLILLLIFFFVSTATLDSFAWTVSPVKFELKGEKGKEYTLSFSVLNESQTAQKRFKLVVDDWGLDKRANFVIKGYSSGTLEVKESAVPWLKVTPTQFVVPPGGSRRVRFTVSIPPDVQGDGDYTAGIFVSEENIEKPPKGKRIVFIKQNTLIGVVLYTQIGQEKQNISLTNLLVESALSEEKESYNVAVIPVFENMSNIHLRGNIKVLLTPSLDQILTKEQKAAIDAVEKELLFEDTVVLRDSYVEHPFKIPQPLPAGSEWLFEVKADFGKQVPLLLGKKKFKVPIDASPSPSPSPVKH